VLQVFLFGSQAHFIFNRHVAHSASKVVLTRSDKWQLLDNIMSLYMSLQIKWVKIMGISFLITFFWFMPTFQKHDLDIKQSCVYLYCKVCNSHWPCSLLCLEFGIADLNSVCPSVCLCCLLIVEALCAIQGILQHFYTIIW
jgi:hypothetical protein